MARLYDIGEWGSSVTRHLPPRWKSVCLDIFFAYMPIWLIRILWKELDGYFKLKVPQRNQVVVDAGAWTGHVTVVAARLVGPRGRVVAIEPQKVMCDRLKIRLQRLGLNSVTVVNSALFDRTSELAVPAKNSSTFNVFSQALGTEQAELVTLRTLDEILSTLGVTQVDFIKMDIEGAELEALQGMRSTLSSAHPFLAIASYHRREGATTSSRVEEILKSFNYTAKTGHPRHPTTWGWYDGNRKSEAGRSRATERNNR
jgi:FkbM family methyltransferase